ncbi:hypothetical protein ORJ66_17175 [Pseudoalteromonas tunicata]|uniref:hypothetical protein n=1 Tax=Pseudoalteromonas tunicata TaxID=314281 RepID=UPI00273D4CD5|nr:hypothetical protein [Pseudoalteromonas tunicata]MDP5214786.1 hypothetical protein [Pseudoalteromonas tunicata]
MFMLNKFSQLLLSAGLMVASGLVMAEQAKTTVIKLEKELSDVKVLVDEGQGSQFIHFDKSELGSAELDEKINQLPADTQEKVRKLLAKMAAGDGKNVFILDDKTIETFSDDTSHKMVFISNGDELNFDIPSPPPAPNAPAQSHNVKVMKFAFEMDGEEGHEFMLIKTLLQKAKLNPEQIDEIQTLLNSK